MLVIVYYATWYKIWPSWSIRSLCIFLGNIIAEKEAYKQFQLGILVYISPVSKNACDILTVHHEICLDNPDVMQIVGKVDFAIINEI